MAASATLRTVVTADTNPFERAVNGALSTARRFGSGAAAAGRQLGGVFTPVTRQISSLISPILGIGAALAGAFSGRAIISGVTAVFDYGRALKVASRETGGNVRSLALLQGQFRASGLDASALVPAILKVQKAVAGIDDEGTGAPKALQGLGLNLAELQKMDPAAQFTAVGKAISSIQDPADRTAAAMKIFGRAGGELNAVFTNNFGNFTASQQAKATSLAKNAADYERASILIGRAGNSLKTFYTGVAEGAVKGLLPILQTAASIDLTGIGRSFGSAIAVGAKALMDAVNFFVGAFKNPKELLGTLGDVLQTDFRTLGNVLAELFVYAGTLLGGYISALPSALGLAAKGFGLALLGAGEIFLGGLVSGMARVGELFLATFRYVARDGVSLLLDNLIATATGFGAAMKAALTGNFRALPEILKSTADAIFGNAEKGVKGLGKVLADVMNAGENGFGKSLKEQGVRNVRAAGGEMGKAGSVMAGVQRPSAPDINNPADVFGADEYRRRALERADALKRSGAAALAAGAGKITGTGTDRGVSSQPMGFNNRFFGGSTAGFALQTPFGGNVIGRGALSRDDRGNFTGGLTTGSLSDGPQAVPGGVFFGAERRRRAAEAERAVDPGKAIQDTAGNTKRIADILQREYQ